MKRSTPLVIVAAALTIVTVVALTAFVWGGAPPPAPTPAGSTASAAVTSSTPTASPDATASPTASPGPSGSLPVGTFQNEILGYRITLPGYRRERALVFTGRQELGVDLYTRQTEQRAREVCMSDSGDIGVLAEFIGNIRVGVSTSDRGVSAQQWAVTSPWSTHQKLEATTIGGHDAVRMVQDNATAETTAFAIRVDDRMYLISLDGGLPDGSPRTYLDALAATFVAVPRAPFPIPTATVPPRQAAQMLADQLATAFASRDADAVARLMSDCWLFVSGTIDGEGVGGVLYRSVSLFTQAFRERSARGELAVTIDRTLQPDQDQRAFSVASEWRYADRTTKIDLRLLELDGRWLWYSATPHYQRAEVINGCIPYRSPLSSSETGAC